MKKSTKSLAIAIRKIQKSWLYLSISCIFLIFGYLTMIPEWKIIGIISIIITIIFLLYSVYYRKKEIKLYNKYFKEELKDIFNDINKQNNNETS